MEYQVIHYDVWGNRSDGWEVNDCRYTPYKFDLEADCSILEIKRALYKSGYCNRGIFGAKIEIDGERGYSLYINLTGSRYAGKPFCELRPTSH